MKRIYTLLFACWASMSAFLMLSPVQVSPKGEGIKIVLQDYNNKDKTNYYFRVEYPKVSYPDETVQHDLNLFIQKAHTGALEEFVTKASTINVIDPTNLPSMEFSYISLHAKNQLVSFMFYRTVSYANQYLTSNNLILTLNYDLKQNKRVVISDIIDLENQVNKERFNELWKKYAPAKLLYKKEYLEDYAISEQGIHFFIEPMLVAELGLEMDRFVIPWQQGLQKMLVNKNFVKVLTAN